MPLVSRNKILVAAILSALLLVPNFWHHHIQAGDLGSHTYNAWLAQLIDQGKAPGLYLATQFQNVLFDFLLAFLVKFFGFTLGEELAVSFCVLIFFWGVFALLRAATQQSPWLLSPLLAMTAYGYVFHMGFMNYYLSIGLACAALACLWTGTRWSILTAAVLAPCIVLAHPLGLLLLIGVGLYRFAWLRLSDRGRLIPMVGAAILLGAVRLYVVRHPQLQADWAEAPFYQWNGSDQFRIFGESYDSIATAVLLLALIFAGIEAFRAGNRNAAFWKDRRLLLELYVLSFLAATVLPEDLRPDPQGSWIGGLATRLTLICTIFAMAFLASLPRRAVHLAAFAIVAALFFVLVHRDTGVLDRMEQNAGAITRSLPYGTRVAATIYSPPGFRTQFEHLVDRACIGHCYLYSNYEPSTLKFRVRVYSTGSRLVASTVDESEDLQSGNYSVEDNDLPLKQIYQCDPSDLTRLCIRDLHSGETNGGLGYRPAL